MTEHHGGDLGVEQRMRNRLGAVPDDFDILAGGVKHLQYALIAHQIEERGEVDVGRQRVDHHGFFRTRQLRDAEQRVIGGFAQEFGVDRDERVLAKALTGGGQLARRFDRFHSGLLAHDPEKWKPVFGKDHAQTKGWAST